MVITDLPGEVRYDIFLLRLLSILDGWITYQKIEHVILIQTHLFVFFIPMTELKNLLMIFLSVSSEICQQAYEDKTKSTQTKSAPVSSLINT